MASRFGTLTGKNQIIGHGVPQAFPVTLDPSPFEGAVIYADNGELRYSDGTAWLPLGTGPQGTTGDQGIQGNQGVQGDYGPGFSIIGSVPDVDAGGDPQATLNAAFGSAVIGEGVIDEADDELWIYDGTNWVNIGSFRGEQGLQGTQGVQGLQGQLGYEGIQGHRGFRGNQGVQGTQGFQGIQGDLGFQGTQGSIGPQGTQGFTGIQGNQGLIGYQGIQGVQGTQGFIGVQGYYGFQGYSGTYGGVSFEFDLDLTTIAQDPTAGKFAINNGDPTLATAMFIDDEAKSSQDVSALLNSIDTVPGPVKGYIQLTRISNNQESITFEIIDVTDNAGWLTLQINHVQNTAGVMTGVASDPAFIMSFGRVGAQGTQGTQGLIGSQGTQGFVGQQGIQGDQGVQGTDGFQGSQGTQGIQGNQGLQGDQGTQGVQGSQGTQGSTGDFGGITYDYDYDNNTTDADPGEGTVRFSNTNFSSADLKLWIDDEDNGGVNVMDGIAAELDAIVGSPKGYIRVIDATDIYNQVLFKVDAVTDKTGYWELDVVRVNGVTNFTDGTDIRVTFSRNGDRGIQGLQGSQGLQGGQGVQGGQGTQGTQGGQGTQGFQGNQGVQGESIQGSQGTQGLQGIQGFQGFQGNQGTQGTTGGTGLQGTQGLQGLQGVQGEQGEYGGLTFAWNYSSNIVGGTDPGTNNFKFNSTNPTLATLITVDDVPADQYNTEIDPFLDFIKSFPGPVKGYLKIQVGAGGDPGPGGHHWLVYEIEDFTWDGGSKNYGYFDVNYVDGNASSWTTVAASHGNETLITFIPRGPAGIQGFTGIQGTQGLQGRVGAGAQGLQGDQGVQGDTGAAGAFGGVTFDYTYSTNTVNNDPTPGYLKFNNTTFSSATALYIDDRDDNFVLIEPFLRTIDDSTSPIKGHFKVTKVGSPEIFQIFTIASLTELTGYFNVTCGFVSGNGSFANDEDVTITFARTGDAGATGSIGPQGVQGPQGMQGGQGVQGPIGQGIQGDTGGGGTQGPQGLQGTQGGTGATGGQGVQGFIGVQGDLGFQGPGGSGAQGVDGIQGPQGTQGIIGPGGTGPQGIQGIQGNQGFQGVQGGEGGSGEDGQPGPEGSQGLQGPQGLQGVQGIPGIGAQGTSGQGIQGVQGEANQGVQGAQGPDGFGSQGLQGPQGLQGGAGGPGGEGPDGAQGIQGLQGTDGAIGATGQGVQGVQGWQGTQGFQGADGTGSQGSQGFQGFQGQEGPPGAGTQGVQGTFGFQGTQGDAGVQGQATPGIQGPQGTQGFQGIQGPPGTGDDGIQGTQGFQGNQGPPGELGGYGTQGTQGFYGFQGNQGTIGAGEPGIQGYAGVQGFPGDGGGSGPQGAAGDSGGIGPEGPQGPAGAAGSDGVGAQGATGPDGPSGEGIQGPIGATGQGVQGNQGPAGSVQGIQGVQGNIGQGTQGAAGGPGAQGLSGWQGVQGNQGPTGLTGADSTEPGPQGVQGSAIQGIQGPGGSTTEVEVDNIHTSGLQTTAMFLTLVQGGSGARPLYGTTGPNPESATDSDTDLETNMYYTSSLDELTVENLDVNGGITLGGVTEIAWPSGGGAGGYADKLTTSVRTNENIDYYISAVAPTLGAAGGNNYQASLDFYWNASDESLFSPKYTTTGSISTGESSYISGDYQFFVPIGELKSQWSGTTYTPLKWLPQAIAVTGTLTATGDISAPNFNSTSDESLKENVHTITNALDKVDSLRGVNFNWIDSGESATGVIAQEIEQILPEVVSEVDGVKHVAYGNVVGVLIEAIKELKAEIDDLKK